jgi:hypothetical protein
MEVSGQLYAQLLYLWGKPLYQLDARLGGPQSWPECGGKDKNLFPVPARN